MMLEYDEELMNAIDSIPKAELDRMTATAIREKRMPPPDGYDENDEPLWTLESIARFYGLNGEKARQSIERFKCDYDVSDIDVMKIRRVN